MVWQGKRHSGRGGSRGAVRAALMVVVAVSLLLMHGLGVSHAPSADLADPATGAAHVASSSAVLAHSHAPSSGFDVPPTGHQDQGSGHAGMMMKACLAVLGALVFAVAGLLLARKPWRWDVFRTLTAQAQQFRAGQVWLPPHPHLLCVMRT